MIVTDGSISFALFLYDETVRHFMAPHRVGFDAGDQRRSLNLDQSSGLDVQELIFRIDG